MKTAKFFCRRQIIFILLTFFFLPALCVYGSRPEKKAPLSPGKNMGAITRTALYLLTHEHFLLQKVDEGLSAKLFDEYFKALDPSRIYFTQQDIAAFESQRRLLGVQLRQGNVQFAFDVYNVFLRKLAAYEKFTVEYLKTKPSLNGSDFYAYNRSKVPWETSEQALRRIWEKKIRNDLILFELLDRSRQQEAKQKNTRPAKKDSKKLSEKNVVPAGKVPAKIKELTPEERTVKRLSRFLQHFRNLESMDVLELYLSTLFGIYDPHSAYMAPRTVDNFNINMKLSLVGIGAVLTSEDGYTKIVRIIPGGPAERDKRLKAEDRIIAVAQENAEPVDIMDMPLNKVVSMIRGEENTKVTLTILESSKGNSAVPVNITLTRAKVPLKDSEVSGKLHKIKAGNRVNRIGVITIPSFYIDFSAAYRGDPDYKSSTKDVIRTFRDLSKEGPLDGLVIDLRSNGGGSLLEAVTLSGLFIPEGPIVQVRSQYNCKTNSDQDGGKIIYNGPLALLTNRFSASAAEIFAAAIQDYKRGILLGDSKTHGKGSVQSLIELDRYTFFLGSGAPAGSVKLTNAKFYRVNGASTQLRGVSPDIVFPSFTDVMEVGEDKLDFALKWDKVSPVPHVPFFRDFENLVQCLRESSRQRVEKNSGFLLLKKDIAALKDLRQRKEVILNLEKRWKEYLAEKKLQEEQKQLLRTDVEEVTSSAGKKTEQTVKDLYLQEALAVLGDWIRMQRSPVSGATARHP